MRLQSPAYRGCSERTMAAAGMIRAAVVLSTIGLGAAAGISQAAAQEAAGDVAYVEAVSGRVVAFSRGAPVLLDTLDIISDRTRLDLQANSELRICHYRTQRLVALAGPSKASISADGVTAANGKAVAASAETCAVPVVSNFQGGLVARGIDPNMDPKTTTVPLQPAIKVVSRGANPINKIALWDGKQQTVLGTFDRRQARPTLEDGQSYLLVVERSDGSELKMKLKGSATVRPGPVIVVVP
jgi:hypothetical protein